MGITAIFEDPDEGISLRKGPDRLIQVPVSILVPGHHFYDPRGYPPHIQVIKPAEKVLTGLGEFEHDELTETSEVVETGHVMLFLARDFVITVRHGAPTELSSLRAGLEEKPELLAQGPWAVAHGIYDRIVDSYLDCAAQIELDIDQLEDSVFARDRRGSIQRIYQLKRELVEFKRAVLPLQRPLADIAGGHHGDVPVELQRYFRDVNDHLSRTVDQVVSFDDLLNSILTARLTQVTVDQNDDMRKIAAWAGIAAVWTAIAGIYGMNFDKMPELHWTYGYPIMMGICLIASVVLYRQFRKSGWL